MKRKLLPSTNPQHIDERKQKQILIIHLELCSLTSPPCVDVNCFDDEILVSQVKIAIHFGDLLHVNWFMSSSSSSLPASSVLSLSLFSKAQRTKQIGSTLSSTENSLAFLHFRTQTNDGDLLCNLCAKQSNIIQRIRTRQAYLPATGTSSNTEEEAPGGGPVIAHRQR